MLSSRYLHLHEALGLGPMWLNRSAALKPARAPTATAAPKAAAVAETAPQAPRTLSPSAHQARMAAVAHADDAAKTPTPPASAHKPAIQPAAAETASAAPLARVSDGLPPLNITVRPSELMVVSICPSTEDRLAGLLFCGSVGILLDNMLAAIGLTPQQAHKTCWVKTVPLSGTNPDTAQIEEAAADLQDELFRSGAKAVLFLGQVFEKEEQQTRMRSLCGSLPYAVIPHPARLLRQPLLKAQAWAELKTLKRALRQA